MESQTDISVQWNFECGNLQSAVVHKFVSKASLGDDDSTKNDDAEEQCISLWIRPDCHGEPFERFYRTWFYFSITGIHKGIKLRMRLENMGKQTRLFQLGYTPLYRIGEQGSWTAIAKTDTTYWKEGECFKLAFSFILPTDISSCEEGGSMTQNVVYFALTYPYTFSDLKNHLAVWKSEHRSSDVYFHEQPLCESLQGRPVQMITISGLDGICDSLETLPSLFDENQTLNGPKLFRKKSVIFLSARVHPGETGSSYVIKGIIDFLLYSKRWQVIDLLKRFVFKIVPMLNPDGVAVGNYRCDTRGVNLNRVYNTPRAEFHPAVYAVRNLLVWYNAGKHLSKDSSNRSHPQRISQTAKALTKSAHKLIQLPISSTLNTNLTYSSSQEDTSSLQPIVSSKAGESRSDIVLNNPKNLYVNSSNSFDERKKCSISAKNASFPLSAGMITPKKNNARLSATPLRPAKFLPTAMERHSLARSANFTRIRRNLSQLSSLHLSSLTHKGGLYFYVDIHGHVSKPGCFIYGNHFGNEEKQAEGLVFAKILSQLAEPFFDLQGCCFSQANMRQKDKTRQANGSSHATTESKEGAGRVAIYRATGATHCYTLECNYYGGYIGKESDVDNKNSVVSEESRPVFQFTPEVYSKVGEALLLSMQAYSQKPSRTSLLPQKSPSRDSNLLPGRVQTSPKSAKSHISISTDIAAINSPSNSDDACNSQSNSDETESNSLPNSQSTAVDVAAIRVWARQKLADQRRAAVARREALAAERLIKRKLAPAVKENSLLRKRSPRPKALASAKASKSCAVSSQK